MNHPATCCLHNLFEAQVAKSPLAAAVAFNDKHLSYQELNQKSNQLAHRLILADIKPNERIAICCERSLLLIVALLAAQKSGGAYVPLDAEYPAERLKYMLEDSGARVFLCQKKLAEKFSELPAGAELILLSDDSPIFNSSEIDNPTTEVTPDNYLYAIYTSGSTGLPKGSLVYHRGAINLLNWYCRELNFDPQSRPLLMTSYSFDLTQKNIYAPLISGGCLYLLPTQHYDANVIADSIAQHSITSINCTPSAFYGLVTDTSASSLKRLHSLKYVVLGGEPILVQRFNHWLQSEHCQATIINSYGPTECSDVVSSYRLHDFERYLKSGVPIGRPIDQTELFVMNQELAELPPGEEGELCIAGAGVGAGYLNRDEYSAERFRPHPRDSRKIVYRTGDRAKELDDGNFEYLGRIDLQVKVRGFRIELGEIESKLEDIEGIREAVVLAKPDNLGDNRLVAYLVPSSAAEQQNVSEIRAQLQKHLPDFMLPTAWVFMEKMPLNPNGKLDRNALPDPEQKRPELSQAYLTAKTPLEKYLANSWEQLLNLDKVGIRDRFFELGGTSIRAIQFIAKLGQELNDAIPIASFFAAPTIEGIIGILEKNHLSALLQKFPDHQVREQKRRRATIPASSKPIDFEDDIAIIGFSGRFPGAEDIDEFWENLRAGVESVQFANNELLRLQGVSEEEIADSDYQRAFFSAPELDGFDAQFFGYQPREAELMDPQHRLFLELAWTALDNAGYADLDNYHGRIGVFGGVARDAYLHSIVSNHPDHKEAIGDFYINLGNDKNFPVTRVAYKLNLNGPAVNVQTACSTSGVALHLACQNLILRECDIALIGGCRVISPTETGYRYVEGGPLSSDGHLRAFDADASGMVRGSGGAFLVVKRLTDALADGDCIRGIVKSTAINNDGDAKIGFTAPGVEGQEEVILTALEKAKVDPETIGYIETHGTATALGDPIEATALTNAFRRHTEKTGYCRIGSVKTNIGHLDAGSANASIIKTVLALEKGEIPPSLNYLQPNQNIDFAKSPFIVNSQLYDWKERTKPPRRAGVSSFGLGGTNFHTILEQSPDRKGSESSEIQRPWQFITLSAKSMTSLHANLAGLVEYHRHHPDCTVEDLAFSLNSRRPLLSHRITMLCRSDGELSGLELGTARCEIFSGSIEPPVFLFPAHGQLTAAEWSKLLESEWQLARYIDDCCQSQIDGPTFSDPLERVNYLSRQSPETQLFFLEYSLARLWITWGIAPSAVFGSGTGKIVAACIAGVFSLVDALRLLAAVASDSLDAVAKCLAQIQLQPPDLPTLSDVSSDWVNCEVLATPDFWLIEAAADNSFSAAFEILEQRGTSIFLNVGTGKALFDGLPSTPPNLPERRLIAGLDLSLPDPAYALTDAVAQIWKSGLKIDWTSYYRGYSCRRVPLPPYRFQRRRHWLDLPAVDPKIVAVAAADENELNQSLSQWTTYFQQHPDCHLSKMAVSSQTFSQPLRFGLVAHNIQQISNSLSAGNPQATNRVSVNKNTDSLVFLFPGGGTQYLQMGRGLYRRFAEFRSAVDDGLALFGAQSGYNLKQVWFAADHRREWAHQEIQRPSVQLPAIFILEMALAKLWMSWGLKPTALIGHSLGENCAACLAGILSYEDTLRLVTLRGKLFEKIEKGGMLSVPLSPDDLKPYLDGRLDIAIINSPQQCTVSGLRHHIDKLRQKLEEDDIETQLIQISTAAHSRLLEPVLAEFEAFLRQVELKPPKIPLISNFTGDWLCDTDATDPAYWVKHLRNTVKFSSGLQNLAKQNSLFLEIGPGKSLCSLLKAQFPELSQFAVSSLRHEREEVEDQLFFLNSLCKLWLAGATLDFGQIKKVMPDCFIPLPLQPPAAAATQNVQVFSVPATTPEPHSSAGMTARATMQSRKELIVGKLKKIIEDMSGINCTSIDSDMPFLNMGFDSLFLTQANLKFKKAFGVKTTLKQLMSDAPTVSSLADYIDQQLPEEALAEELQVQPSQPAATIATPSANLPAPSLPGDLQQAIALHIQTSTALLGYLQGGAAFTQPTPQPTVSLPSAQETQSPPASESAMPTGSGAHGPFVPLQKSVGTELSEQQKNYLAEFIREYEQKTAGSKKLATDLRPHYADPRTVMGFKALWKELTYTIAAKRSKGSRVWDIDGNEYIDCMGGFGSILLGHAPDYVIDAVHKQLDTSIDYGPQSAATGRVARLIQEFTGMERVSFCNTGSEAALAAMRLARTATGNDLIVTFQGDYHGIFDEVLVRVQDVGGKRKNLPVAPGIPASASQNILMLDYGDPQSLQVIRDRADEIAGVIVEPIQSRHPELQPKEFLHQLRDLTREVDIPLIFDEIITGFRLHPRGAQGWFDVEADIACYGKVVGGGFPIGVIAGKRCFMDALDGGAWQFGDDSFPEIGVTYFAGTFIRHPVALAAAEAVLLKLKEEGPQLQRELNKKTAVFAESVNRRYRQLGVPIELVYFGSAFFIRYYGDPDFEGLYAHHLRHFGAHHIWGNRPGFLTTTHSDSDLAQLVESFVQAAQAMQTGGFLPAFEDYQEEFHPWTSVQSEIWLAGQMDASSAAAYNEQVMFEINNRIDPVVLELALDRVTNRHPSLRSIAAPAGDGLLVKGYMPPRFEYLDFSEISEECQWADVLRRAQQNIDEPFDFQNGPLLRTVLIKLKTDSFILCVSASHLVCDGWSLEIVMEDIAGFYTAISQSRHFGTRPVPALADFFKTVEEKRTSDEFKEAKDYWLSIYQDSLPPDLDLPLDHLRPRTRSYRGERHYFYLDSELCEPMRKFAQSNGCTSFVLLLSVYLLLLKRLSGQDDIVVGIPAAGQPDLGLTDSVAHAVSLLPLRTVFDDEQSIVEFLHSVRDGFMDAKDNQSFSYGELLKLLPIPRDPSRQPLLSASFNVDMAFNPLNFDGVMASFIPAPRGHSKVDLLFTLTDEGEQVLIEVDRNVDIIDASTIERWVGYYQVLLREIIRQPEQKIGQVGFLSDVDRRLLFEKWNQPPTQLTDEPSFLNLFAQQVAATPQKTAVIFADHSLTYHELEQNSNRIANYLIKKGLQRGALVGVAVDRSEQMLVALLGILKAGAGYLPLDPLYPAERLMFMAQDAGLACLITESHHLNKFESLNLEVIVLDRDEAEIAAVNEKHPELQISPDDVAYVIYTSGSTGQPKGVVVPHRCVVNLLCALQQRPGISADDIFLSVMSISFDPAVIDLYLPLISGATVLIASAEECTDGELLKNLQQNSKASMMNATPTTWRFLLATGWSPQGRFKVLCGGEALPPELARDLAGKVSELWNMYGPTEATVAACGYLVPKEGEPILIGKPFANIHLYVLDENAQPQPPEIPGELYIGGYGVAAGYLNREQLTAERFVTATFEPVKGERLYRTGDIVRYKSDGNLEFLGRNDNQVKIRGLRIELGEIETCLEIHAAVAQAVVLAREDRVDDRRLVAYLTTARGNTIDESTLRTHAQSILPDYMVPQHFVVLDSLPITANGKVDRNALPAPEINIVSDAEGLVLPRNETEQKFADCWSAVLSRPQVGMTDDFFALGGHSLLGIQMLAKMNAELGTKIGLKDLFQFSTIRQLAELADNESSKDMKHVSGLTIPVRNADAVIPASSQQLRVWYLGQLDEMYMTAHNAATAFSLRGPLNIAALQKTFNVIFRRHEALRTNVTMTDEGLLQVVQPEVEYDMTPSTLTQKGVETVDELIEKLKQKAAKPLNLENDRLFYVELVKVSSTEHILMLITNHLIFDGWSYDLLFDEICTLYNAFCLGQEPILPPLPVQYGDYSIWQRDWLQSEKIRRQLDFWADNLKSELPILDLPLDQPRPPEQTHLAAEVRFAIDEKVLDQLEELARNTGCTLFMVIIALYTLMLHRFTRQEDIVVGSPISGRNIDEIGNLLGFFVNTLMFRFRLNPQQSFSDWLQEVKQACLEAYDNQDAPFELIVQKINPPRDRSRSTVFQSLFIYQDVRNRSLHLHDIELSNFNLKRTGVQTDLDVWTKREQKGLWGGFIYPSKLFTEEKVQRFANSLVTIAGLVAKQPDLPLADLAAADHLETSQVEQWNQTDQTLHETTLIDHLRMQMGEYRQRTAIVFEDQKVTYSELDQRSNRLAHYLCKNGVAPGSLVGICLNRSDEMLIAVLAIWKAGAAYVPLDPDYPELRLQYMMETAELSIIVTESELEDIADDYKCRRICIDTEASDIGAENDVALEQLAKPENLAYVIFTSGSTGKPKGVMLSHKNVFNFLQSMAKEPGMKATDRLLAVTTLSFDIHVLELYMPLLLGATVIIAGQHDTSDGQKLLRLLHDNDVNIMQATPSTWRLLSTEGWAGGKGFKVLCGGEAFPPDLAQTLLAKVGELWNMYGPTETTVWSTCFRITDPNEQILIGHPIDNTYCYVLDENLRQLPIGIAGELFIGGEGVAAGYLKQPDLTAERFIPDPFCKKPDAKMYRTGDLVRWRANGQLEYFQRIDNQVKVRGYRIELGEIETILSNSDLVKQAVVSVWSKSHLDQRLVAYIIPEDEDEFEALMLRKYLRNHLPEYMVPQHFVRMDNFPQTPNGKIDRKALPAPTDVEPTSMSVQFSPPKTELEKQLATIWKELIGIEQISVHDNFFDLGGHSLLSMQLIAKARESLSVQLTPRMILLSTLGQIANEIQVVSA